MVQPNHLSVNCESCQKEVNPNPPEKRLWFVIGFIVILGGIGFVSGTALGVATAGVGFTATIPLGIIGSYAGYKVGGFIAELLDGYSCPDCGYVFSAPSLVTRIKTVVATLIPGMSG